MELSRVTIQDCLEMSQYRDMSVILNDGAVLGFRGESIKKMTELRWMPWGHWKCPCCGANLDAGEKCGCRELFMVKSAADRKYIYSLLRLMGKKRFRTPAKV